ncbi:MAG: hypothetical protein A2806_03955 [Candidatus Terrybacteria bacterium RIFCSPHIGHO2_01_FULL_48_17]|uniref:Uncharacterized protein n=1 Tax=Candidatus Terrybacteria bacterium RIFCSPHIGHO2_01_FULL_48_17 TaxID=1802362 RepID=A0A1G2PMI8_9BACT|nr:MAG: hypothetical protein A2806_03955 [Candidatus Terrybacteria bacterium RIFCSPHIGHO2_01_FULL_48_17]OHA53304.1 MAG: hypothetical protein A3A30_03945 [Candidatus Terrybacteria bacterium RIFCSPLOWO2_01_FULL_48_14]
MGSKSRYTQRHDEHYPPEDGVEKAIYDILTERGPLTAIELWEEVKRRGFPESDARVHASYLADRGWLELTDDCKFRALSERLNPAPTDLF